MANYAWRNVKARCPYYIRSRDRTITCQGINQGEELRRRFPSDEDCSDAFCACCAMHYTRCPVYKLHETETNKK